MPHRGEGAGGAPESIFEPFENQEKPSSFKVGQATEFRKILSPAPT